MAQMAAVAVATCQVVQAVSASVVQYSSEANLIGTAAAPGTHACPGRSVSKWSSGDALIIGVVCGFHSTCMDTRLRCSVGRLTESAAKDLPGSWP